MAVLQPNETVKQYYDRIGPVYDEDRFQNEYGRFIHQQETDFLDKWLPEEPTVPVLDMGCGTGRLTARATTGADFSEGMLKIARSKFPGKDFFSVDILHTQLPDTAFKTVFCLHVLMHLNKEQSDALFREAFRLLPVGGKFIVDFPNTKRRKMAGRKNVNWHGSNTFEIGKLPYAETDLWKLMDARGILFLPIHRFPVKIRRFLLPFDRFLCRSFLKKYASYTIVVLKKSSDVAPLDS